MNINKRLIFTQAEQGKENLINTAEELQSQKIELEKMVAELRLKFDQAEKRSAELREAEEKKHMEEVQFLKKTNMQLKVRMRVYVLFLSPTDQKKAFVIL